MQDERGLSYKLEDRFNTDRFDIKKEMRKNVCYALNRLHVNNTEEQFLKELEMWKVMEVVAVGLGSVVFNRFARTGRRVRC